MGSEIMTPRLLKASAVASLLAWMTACSSVDLGAAKELGQAGGKGFTEFGDAYALTGKQMSQYKEANILRGALAPVPPGSPIPVLKVDPKSADKVVKEMAARAAAMRAFVRAYKAFEDLATYDAAGEMDKALSNLGDSVMVFAAAVGSPLAAPAAKIATNVVASLGGVIAGEDQKARVKSASQAIRANLETFKEIHDFAEEQKAIVDTRKDLFNAQLEVASGLWRMGVLTANKYAASWAVGSGLDVVDEKTQPITTRTYPGLATPINNALRARREAERDAIEQVYAETGEAIGDLISAHKKLEAGVPIGVAELRARIAQLEGLLTRLSTAATSTTK
jgi:hypothetical protein